MKNESVYEWNGRIYDGHELHAESLSFEHPVTGVPVVFRAPLPSWPSRYHIHYDIKWFSFHVIPGTVAYEGVLTVL